MYSATRMEVPVLMETANVIQDILAISVGVSKIIRSGQKSSAYKNGLPAGSYRINKVSKC